MACWCDDPGVSAARPSPRWIALDGAVNARVVVPRVLLRADNLQSLSARDVRLLVEDEAIEVVLDLRTDVEVELEGPGPMTAELAVRIEHRSLYPDSGAHADLGAGTIEPWGRADVRESPDEPAVVRAYMSYLRRRPDSIVGSVRTIARADGAVLVHCAAGKDRTGVVVALALDAAGVDRGAIVADYLATGARIDAIIARLVSSPTYRRGARGTRRAIARTGSRNHRAPPRARRQPLRRVRSLAVCARVGRPRCRTTGAQVGARQARARAELSRRQHARRPARVRASTSGAICPLIRPTGEAPRSRPER